MPDTATPMTSSIGERIDRLFAAAAEFIAPDRVDALMRKWLSRHPADLADMTEERRLTIMADAIMLAAELLVAQPSASGATAVDRLSRSLGSMTPAEAAAIASIRDSRFRLLAFQEALPQNRSTVQDILSGEQLRIEAADLPPMARGTPLFARLVSIGDRCGCLAGAITPLDDSALHVARAHPAAGATTLAANARWGEAVFAHVVRHGTLEIGGLNRPEQNAGWLDRLSQVDGGLVDLATAWVASHGGEPAPELLHQTRQATSLTRIFESMEAALAASDAGDDGMTEAFESILRVQLDTVWRRGRGGSAATTLDTIAQALDEAIASREWPARSRGLFDRLRPAARERDGGPALDRLVQRIQGLRAKTVDQGCTEQEAMAAAEKVAELLDRYGLSLSELELQAQPCEGVGVQTTRRRRGPIDDCVPSIAAFFDCKVWVERSPESTLRYVFFGLRGDVAAAQYLFELVERAFETETATFRQSEIYGTGDRRNASNSFQIGLSRGISTKLSNLRAARDAVIRSASGRDLVPVKAAMVEEELAKLGLGFDRLDSGRSRRVMKDAFEAGHEAGERFEFAAAITASR